MFKWFWTVFSLVVPEDQVHKGYLHEYYRQYYFGTNKSSIESGNNPGSWINNLSSWKRTCKNLGFSKNRILTFERPGTMLYPLSLWSQLETRPSCNWCCKDQGSSSSHTWNFLVFFWSTTRIISTFIIFYAQFKIWVIS